MRFIVCCVLLAVVTVAAAIPANLEEVPQTLNDVDLGVQGHENVGDREARQFGYGGYPGGYGGYGGYPGGYGGYGGHGGYGGYGGYGGHHHHHHGGHHGGYGGYGRRGGFYG